MQINHKGQHHDFLWSAIQCLYLCMKILNIWTYETTYICIYVSDYAWSHLENLKHFTKVPYVSVHMSHAWIRMHAYHCICVRVCVTLYGMPCSITLRSVAGVSFQSAGPTTAKVRFWDRVQNHGIRRSQWSAERSGRYERADKGLAMSSQRYFGARQC